MNIVKIGFVSIFLIFMFCHYESQRHAIAKITEERGLDNIQDGVRPDIIKIKKHIYNATSIAFQNKFACLFEDGFGIAEILPDMKITGQPVVKRFPNNLTSAFYADDSATMICGKTGNGTISMLGVADKCTSEVVIAPKDIIRIYGVDVKRMRVLTRVIYKPPCSHVLFDVKKGIDIRNITFDGNIFPFKDNICLACESVGPDTNYRTVSYFSELTDSGLQNRTSNKLTQAMTDNSLFIQTWFNTRPLNIQHHILICHKDLQIKKTLGNYTARWDSAFQNIKIEPMISQCPRFSISYGSFGSNWTFSPDGNWLMNKAFESHQDTSSTFLNDRIEANYIVFYHVSPEYPNGISPPVFGGKTMDHNYGCFVNHSTLGPLYIDLYHSGDYVLVYKLNQVLDVLAKRKNKPV